MRNESRIPKTFRAVVERVASVIEAGASQSVAAESLDVSLHGIGFIAAEPFDRDAYVRVTVFMDASQADAGIGKRFVTEARIRECVRRPDGRYHVGLHLQERTTREIDDWGELITRWSSKIM